MSASRNVTEIKKSPVLHDMEWKVFEKSQTTTILKAINRHNSPAKAKHVRSTIMGTYQEKGAKAFWHAVQHLPLSTQAITCWKFCYVLHKLLREGHEKTLECSIKYKRRLEDLSKLWICTQQSYGSIISDYCKCLVLRMEMQEKYTEFPGDLVISDETLEASADNGYYNLNHHFTLCIDIINYLDSLMELTDKIFQTIDTSKDVSVPDQCRLTPCIPIILDCSQLYFYTEKILLKLHVEFPFDSLSGHRDRFRVLFMKLKHSFYQVDNVKYFKSLFEIPGLPQNPPEFILSEAEPIYESVM